MTHRSTCFLILSKSSLSKIASKGEKSQYFQKIPYIFNFLEVKENEDMSGSVGLKLFDLLDQPGNSRCADCGCDASAPKWASISLGIFLCVNCVGSHRSLGVHCSVTKSLELDKWSEEMYESMAAKGNIKSNEIYEKNVPVCWRRPTPIDHRTDFYIEEWIRAKYERKEFMEGNDSKQAYCRGMKDGLLRKRDRNGNSWNLRYFRLSSDTGSLSYYEKKEDLAPIKRLNIKDVNVILCSESKTEKFYSMEIVSPEVKEKKGKPKKSCSRSIYVHAETAKEIIDWYLCIRSAKLMLLKDEGYDMDPNDLNTEMILSTCRIKEGHLKKSGPKENDRYKQRWLTVEPNKFSYFEHKLDATPIQEVSLKPSPEIYSVSEGVDGKHPDEPYPFMVRTPERVFNFGAESSEDFTEWMSAFKKALEFEPVEINRNTRMSIVSTASQFSQLSVSSGDSTASS
ncbi:arf-GAP with dual PH domain-containing protein 1-like isoform X1 [Rhopilema esculentum]|uniref:arf-GAP with dual PH domain-containing protein 1-like isoform X1 n=1 Tax=Rhopilema esculentum TaxID=499914 RepID=UPI0031D33C97